MTPAQLRQWSFRNSQPDQWWLCLDEVMEENPVRSAEIAEYLRGGQYSIVQALHVSQADIQDAPWTEVTMPPVSTPAVKDPVNVESNEQPKTSASAAKSLFGVSEHKMNDTQKAILGIWAIVIVIFFVVAVMTSEDSAGPETEQADESEQQADESEISSANFSGEYTITGDNFTGFSNREDEKRASELASDEEAFSKFFLACVIARRATLFEQGETVILEEFGGFADRLVKVRRKGEVVGYWTNREAID